MQSTGRQVGSECGHSFIHFWGFSQPLQRFLLCLHLPPPRQVWERSPGVRALVLCSRHREAAAHTRRFAGGFGIFRASEHCATSHKPRGRDRALARVTQRSRGPHPSARCVPQPLALRAASSAQLMNRENSSPGGLSPRVWLLCLCKGGCLLTSPMHQWGFGVGTDIFF